MSEPEKKPPLPADQTLVQGVPSEATLAYQDDHLKLLTHDLITNMTKYITGEIQASAEDYVLLEQLNLAAAGRYEDMGEKTKLMLDLFAVCILKNVLGACPSSATLSCLSYLSQNVYSCMFHKLLDIPSITFITLQEIQKKNSLIQPYLNQIDEIHTNVEQLETVMKDLDTYVSHLEMQVKQAYD